MPTSRRIALGLIFVAVLSWVGWTAWTKTRTWCPVDVPLSLSEGGLTTTKDFTVNVSGPYDIAVEATANRDVPLNKVVCSLGLKPLWPEKTCPTKDVLKVSWTLTSHEMKIAEGSSDSEHGGWTAEGWSQAGLTIGSFDAAKGQTFQLRVRTLTDASGLALTAPRLKVNKGATTYESVLVFTGMLNLSCGAIGVLGVVLLVVSFRSTP
jgi:hypothetical protein